MRQIPVDAKRQDWPRLVAQTTNETARNVATVMSNVGGFSRAKLSFLSG